MKKLSKYLVAMFAVALFGAMMVGCSGQQASSGSAAASGSAASEAAASASESASDSQDALIAELETIMGNNDYKSVSLDMQGSVTVDTSSLTAEAESSDSAESADASDEAAEASDNNMTIPMNIKAKCDISSGTVKMSMDMDMMGMAVEMYIDGEKAVMVSQGQAIEATLKELNMEQYASVDTILKSQGGDLSAFKSSIKSIEKTTSGDETVYTLTCDPAQFLSASDSMQSLSQLDGIVSFDSVKVVYRANSAGQLTGLDMDLTGDTYSMTMSTKLYDYDKTVVDPAPEATVKYSDLVESEDAGESTDENADAEEEGQQ